MLSYVDHLKSWEKKGITVRVDNGLMAFHLDSGKNSSAAVYLHGATVYSFKTNGIEHIFMSDKSVYQRPKAIRGGIPIIFPQFGPGKIQQHGFGRNMEWNVLSTSSEIDKVSIQLVLNDSQETRAIWNFQFKAVYTITLHADRLDLKFETLNTDTKPWDFQLALHTYYIISDITNAHVEGLKGVKYIDKTKNLQVDTETRTAVVCREEVDRIYTNITPPLFLVDQGKRIRFDSDLPDAVVWNPWIEKAKKMEDYGDEEYHKMICIEAGAIANPVILQPGDSHVANHSITSIQNNNSSL